MRGCPPSQSNAQRRRRCDRRAAGGWPLDSSNTAGNSSMGSSMRLPRPLQHRPEIFKKLAAATSPKNRSPLIWINSPERHLNQCRRRDDQCLPTPDCPVLGAPAPPPGLRREACTKRATMATKAEVLEALRAGYGCLGRAALDEPVFILRARDILAPKAVVRWAHLAEQAGSPQDKVRSALQVAKQMADWQANNRHRLKVPD